MYKQMLKLQNINPNINPKRRNIYVHMIKLQNINPNVNPKGRKHLHTHDQITKHKP